MTVTLTIDLGLSSTPYTLLCTVRPNVTLSVTGPASVGDVVIFNCTASGGVPSEYSFRWFNGSVEVMSSGSVHIEDDGSTSMLLLLVGPDDFVNYTCTVNNVFTEASDSDVLLESREWSGLNYISLRSRHSRLGSQDNVCTNCVPVPPLPLFPQPFQYHSSLPRPLTQLCWAPPST